MGYSRPGITELEIPTMVKTVLLLAILLLKVVAGDEVEGEIDDEIGELCEDDIDEEEEVLKEGSGILWQKVGKITVGEIVFIIFGVLALICFIFSTLLCLLEVFSKTEAFEKPDENTPFFLSAALGCLFFVAFSTCRHYLYRSNGNITTCQKVCLWIAIILFIAFMSLYFGTIFLYLKNKPPTSCIPYCYLLKFLGVFCFVLYIQLMIGICLQCGIKGIFAKRKIPFLVLCALTLLCLIAMLASEKYTLCTSGSATGNHDNGLLTAFVALGFILVIALLSLCFYMRFFGYKFSAVEVSFGTLTILLVVWLITLIIIKGRGNKNTDASKAAKALPIVHLLLFSLFLYCAYRFHLFDPIIALFMGKDVGLKVTLATLFILIIGCIVALLFLNVKGRIEEEPRPATAGLLAILILLLVAFIDTAYRLHLFDSLVALFKGKKAEFESKNLKIAS
ncbi:MFS transporter, putative [Babesia ovis]|uniref:MFS transporter, putative n=1 Tax=Babesia ovis TaxID=5869 RepID=A0A9W5WVN3_BABOV|nr:MFS transporter, putative [Babesia ovis]